MGHDVAVGVPGDLLAGRRGARRRCIGTASARRWTSVPTPTRSLGFTGRSCLSDNRQGEDEPAGPGMGLAGRSARGGAGRAGDELRRRHGARDPGLPGRRRRRAGGPAQSGQELLSGRSSGWATMTSRAPSAGSCCCSPSPSRPSARLGGPPVVAGGAAAFGALAGRGARGRHERVDGPRGVPAAGRRVRHLGGHPRPAHPGCARSPRARSLLGRGAGSCSGSAAVAVLALGLTGLGRPTGRGRRAVESERALLRPPGVSEPQVPASARIGQPGVSSWETPADASLYLIHTALAIPAIAPEEWRLRIHGLAPPGCCASRT